MVIGYGIIAVPTGIVSAELALPGKKAASNTKSCHICSAEGHKDDAEFCFKCGAKL